MLSILLLAVLGFPMLTLLLAQVQASRAGTMACCRRARQHPCGMMAARMQSSMSDVPLASASPKTHEASAPLLACPCSPQALAASHADASSPPVVVSTAMAIASRPAGVAQTECKWRIARDRSRQKRGPPVVPFS